MDNVIEKIVAKTKWKITRFKDEEAFKKRIPYNITYINGNLLLNEGITALLNLLVGQTETAFDNTNAYIGVGSGPLTSLTGDLTFTNGSATVIGSGTDFTGEISPGDYVQLDADAVLAKVLSVDSQTQLTLTANYSGTGGTGAGSKIPAEVATQTGLQSTTKEFKGMESGYPSITDQTVTFRAVFGATEGNFPWKEFTVVNGNSDSSDNLNRKVSDQGTKASGQTWTIDVAIQFS